MKSNPEWLAWGKVDPLFAVATLDGKSKSDAKPWELDEFLRLGTDDWARFCPHWESYGLARGTGLEIGCGAGRMTQAMSATFDNLCAVDISADMIELAKRHVRSASVRFVVSDGSTLPLPPDAVDAVFSTHVFQHLDSVEEGTAYFREVFRVMAPGATAMIHLPAIAWPKGPFRRLHERLHALQKRLGGVRANFYRLLSRLRLRKRPIMRITSYELGRLERTLRELGFVDVEMRMIFGGPMAAHQMFHTFVFFRKPRAEPA
jgi:ubiquinone/menaquinone biosynthesis C-methylase UbiE